MRPPPASNTASRVTSSASSGTNQTSLSGRASLPLGVVDLRALQRPGVVDVDRLPLREDVERGLPRLAVAVARLLRAAERQVHLGADRAGVDVRDAGLEVAHRAERAVDVPGEDRGREPVADPVRDAERLRLVAEADEGERRPEDLLLGDAHVVLDVAEDRRAVVEALREVALVRDLAAGEERRAVVLADLRVRVDLLERRAVDDRTDVGVVLPARAEAQRLGALDEPSRERVVEALVHDDPARRRAALAGCAERRPDDAVDGEVEVGVVHDDDRVLAAELEVDVLETLGGRLEHLHAGLARARERDHADVRVPDEPLADGSPTPVDDVDDAGRNTRLDEELREPLPEHGRVRRRLEHDRVPGDERRSDLP